MRVILLDDEKTATDELEYYLKSYGDIEIAGIFNAPAIAVKEAIKLKPDVAFLDIDMPEMSGIETAGKLLEQCGGISIVFVTAYNHYAVKAFDINAVDYILKPVDKNRLDKTIEKLVKAREEQNIVKRELMEKLERIERCIKQEEIKIAAAENEEIILIKLSDVSLYEAQLGKTIIRTGYGSFKTKETLDTLEDKLVDFGFFRCHRGYLVNLRHINKLSPMFNGNYVLQMDGIPERIPVSRNCIKRLKELLGII